MRNSNRNYRTWREWVGCSHEAAEAAELAGFTNQVFLYFCVCEFRDASEEVPRRPAHPSPYGLQLGHEMYITSVVFTVVHRRVQGTLTPT